MLYSLVYANRFAATLDKEPYRNVKGKIIKIAVTMADYGVDHWQCPSTTQSSIYSPLYIAI